MSTITRGLAKIECGTLAADGGVATTWAALGKTDRDSPVTQVEADPTIDRLYSHEDDVALDANVTAGEAPFLFTVVDPDLATYAKMLGGTVTGTGGTATYSMPSGKLIQDLSWKITPKKGHIYTIVRGASYAKINNDWAKAGKLALDIVVEPLLPTKANTLPVIIGPLVV